jgi:hypothetical protein
MRRRARLLWSRAGAASDDCKGDIPIVPIRLSALLSVDFVAFVNNVALMSTTHHLDRPASRADDHGRPIEAYPSLRSAAKLIGITAAKLSRRSDVERVQAGREQRIPAAEVVRLAAFYRRRPPSRVAAELMERAISVDPGLKEIIGDEVDAALEQVPVAQVGVSIAAFVEAAQRLLPPVLAEQVDAAVRGGEHGKSAVGWSPGTSARGAAPPLEGGERVTRSRAAELLGDS